MVCELKVMPAASLRVAEPFKMEEKILAEARIGKQNTNDPPIMERATKNVFFVLPEYISLIHEPRSAFSDFMA
jgi:hypothetical protein